jgi:DNA-binding NarL/FixJ family response regulator
MTNLPIQGQCIGTGIAAAESELAIAMQIKVLLVDDSWYFLRAAESFLSGITAVGWIVTAKNGADAVRAVVLERPHVVLIDLNMPGMNGFEAVRQIKALDSAVRIIVVSLHDDPEFRSAALKAGADGYIAKDNFAADLPAAFAMYGVKTPSCTET